ncbi:MAG TPA: flagellar motor protein MotB [Rhodocyclaceae bacterium]|nr:flagellar motor protein MotB [Rhodocyclaceae bacterium]
MSDDSQRPIIVKKIKKGGHGHHGGAWKIAYADFVTAMMAFFLLMWLLGSTARGDFEGISEYFKTPLKVALQGGTGSGDSSSIIKGGGKDLTRQSGQVKRGDIESEARKFALKETTLEYQRKERETLLELKARIERAIAENPQLAMFKNQILLDITAEGLRIQIVDERNRPMFDLSSAELKPYTKEILQQIGKVLNAVPNRISLAGHTDAAQFSAGDRGFSNWELSANRANASRRELITGGMDEPKVLRVVGLASSVLFDKNDPLNPVNRRISIVVMNKKTEMAVLQEEGPETDIGTQDKATPENLKLPVSGQGPAG